MSPWSGWQAEEYDQLEKKYKALEAERDKLSESRSKAISEGEEWRLHWVEAEAEVKELNSIIDTHKLIEKGIKADWDRVVNEKNAAESALGRARKVAQWYEDNLPFNNDVSNSFILAFADDVKKALAVGAEKKGFTTLIDSIKSVLNDRLGVSWIESNFNAGDFDACARAEANSTNGLKKESK